MRISGSTVLITGATGGIGRTLARAFAARGASLLLTGRRPDALHPLAGSLGARAVVADLSDRDEVRRLADEAADVDILIANAALPSSGEMLDYSAEQLDRALEVNLRAPIMLARLLAPRMVRAGRGHLVMIGSIAGRTASPGASLYNASKFGLRGFAHGLRQDLHGTGVGVSIVQPGFVRGAGMFADSGAVPPAGMRTVSPGQVAAAALRAVEHNRAEVNIAPLELRLGTAIGGLFPGLAASLQRRIVPDGTLRQMTEGQRAKR
ncbi:SDR family NAD(P)-dependent oxidoreductase [Streptomyces pactum]|uniref:SDR family NAD(P)-dependent oxidoreductase n=1 Tax=Streptomyces pactum TaxID=68249 RepID=A0ABS0NEL2_9ACTN|nr:SDR family NAD(P)-dependent oxidoreductase [Streptomyces pactum]MBH5333610.1 SDR family NAD(P)-dependent oxidoreductase [Streptomyces pactum]